MDSNDILLDLFSRRDLMNEILIKFLDEIKKDRLKYIIEESVATPNYKTNSNY